MRELVECPYCGFEHVPSLTVDPQGTVVGLFCENAKLLLRVNTTYWNGEDITRQLKRFLNASVRLKPLVKMDYDAIIRLSKKMAYLFLQTQYGKERKINYAFVEYHARDIILAMREKAVSLYE